MTLEARVKSVLSGDTVVLSHIANPGQERTLSLAYVSAPRLRREGDEVSPGRYHLIHFVLSPQFCLRGGGGLDLPSCLFIYRGSFFLPTPPLCFLNAH